MPEYHRSRASDATSTAAGPREVDCRLGLPPEHDTIPPLAAQAFTSPEARGKETHDGARPLRTDRLRRVGKPSRPRHRQDGGCRADGDRIPLAEELWDRAGRSSHGTDLR